MGGAALSGLLAERAGKDFGQDGVAIIRSEGIRGCPAFGRARESHHEVQGYRRRHWTVD